jgi:hypothetical protein
MTVALCAFIAPIIGRGQDAATLAKYDKNHNGRLDPEEVSAMQADQAKNGAEVHTLSPFLTAIQMDQNKNAHEAGANRNEVTLNPFQVDAQNDVGYPRFVENHFFEKIDGLDTRPWRYAKIDNIEVLSRCSDETTKRFVSELRHRLQLMKPVGPERPLASLDCPMHLFLYQQEESWRQTRDAFNNPNASPILSGGKEAITLMVNLWGYENMAKSGANDASLLVVTDSAADLFVEGQLGLKLWQEEANNSYWLLGLSYFYRDLRFASNSVSFAWPPLSHDPKWMKTYAPGGSLPKIDLLPMAAIFNRTPAVMNDRYLDGVRVIQLGLFMRWALVSDHQRHQGAFWKFVARARAEPNTERLFQECFGMSYAKVQAELAGYLQEGRAVIELPPIAGSAMNSQNLMGLRDATAAEVERWKVFVNETIDNSPNL